MNASDDGVPPLWHRPGAEQGSGLAGSNDRINGWKAIGVHFGRDRTTVIRWAQERGLPVRRIPGGKGATVYALKSELDAWAMSQSGLDEQLSVQISDGPAATKADESLDEDPVTGDCPVAATRPPRLHTATRVPVAYVLVGVCIAVLLMAVLAWSGRGTGADSALATQLPKNAQAAQLFLEARDLWARRSAASIASAIIKLQAATELEPTFAPGYAGLADAYLLAREFGSMPDPIAFAKAQQAAARALELDGHLDAAHRAQGFIRYWFEHDPTAAGRSFRRAIELDPDDAQTRFWYGNILVDNGEHLAAARELDRARLLEPGSVAIETDAAWALWSAGDVAGARTQLQVVITRAPDFAVARDCYSIVKLADGDYQGYLDELRVRAQLRGESGLRDYVRDLELGLGSGGTDAMHRLMLARALVDETRSAFPDHSWAAFVASLGGDRAQLIGVLRLAQSQKQVWGSSGFTARIAARWSADAEIAGLLQARRGPRIESGN